MHGLFFEMRPKPGHMTHYFAHVDRLKPVLARHHGLVFLDRYRPLDDAEALLSHQLWADEDAIAAWRADPTHRASQTAGRRVHFEDYRIRVGPALDTPSGAGRYLVAAYGPRPVALAGGRGHESVNTAGRFLVLAACDGADDARAAAAEADTQGAEAVRLFRIDRDYTLTDRAEAPAR
jgi:heme-degrading monooxygenase HmoA